MTKALTKKSTHDLTELLTEIAEPLTDIESNTEFRDIALQDIIRDLHYAIVDLVSGRYCNTDKRLTIAYDLSVDLQIIGEKVDDFGVVQIAMLLRKAIADFAYESGVWK